jgi:heme-degrading monooxygenase HmoA
MVTLINCFEVPEGRDDAFFALWSEVNQYMRAKPGYRRHRLHRANSSEARYRFVNVADWDSNEQFDAAHDEGFRKLVSKPEWREFPATPNLFQVVHENQA